MISLFFIAADAYGADCYFCTPLRFTLTKDLLIQSAARLYTLGVDLEGAREELRQLVDTGTSYDSEEMRSAYHRFTELNEQWSHLETEYLKLRESIRKQAGL